MNLDLSSVGVLRGGLIDVQNWRTLRVHCVPGVGDPSSAVVEAKRAWSSAPNSPRVSMPSTTTLDLTGATITTIDVTDVGYIQLECTTAVSGVSVDFSFTTSGAMRGNASSFSINADALGPRGLVASAYKSSVIASPVQAVTSGVVEMRGAISSAYQPVAFSPSATLTLDGSTVTEIDAGGDSVLVPVCTTAQAGLAVDVYVYTREEVAADSETEIPSNLATKDEATSIALGSTQGLEQSLLASGGQVGKTVLAVAYSYYQGDAEGASGHKAQITSLGEGNVVFVYATGSDFTGGAVQEGPIFLGLGEVYVIDNVRPGAIITATEGAYGYSQQRDGNNESPMPLLSLGLAFKETFLYAFRNSQTYRGGTSSGSGNEGWIHVVNGPIASDVTLTDGSGTVVQGQESISLEPWEYLRLYTDGNQEYILSGTNSIMAAINADMDTNSPRFYDSRLIMPLTNDGITWPRSGFGSALYSGTNVRYWVNDGAAWDQGSGAALTMTPGSPLDIDASQPSGTGANDTDYAPEGCTRFKADGLISAYSGADSSGLEASPMCPVSNMTQRIALPLHIRDSGDGGNNGIAIGSAYEGTARLYQWNAGTGVADLVTLEEPGTGSSVSEIIIERRRGGTTTADHQNYPASANISAAGGTGTGDGDSYRLAADFTGGYIEIDVPAMVVFNSEQNQNGAVDKTFRGTGGSSVVGIHSDDDEQLSFGITPDEIRADITTAADGLRYRRSLGTGGTESWVVA